MVQKRTPTKKQRKALGRAIQEARKINGFTQEQLADYLKCSAHWVNRIECGKSDPNWLDVFRLTSILKLDVEAILQEVDGCDPVPSSRE